MPDPRPADPFSLKATSVPGHWGDTAGTEEKVRKQFPVLAITFGWETEVES